MTKKQRFCRKLLKQRQEGVRFETFMGTKWFVFKSILITITIILFFMDDPFLHKLAFIGSGYLIGMIGSNIRSFIVIRRTWPIHERFIDWEKVNQMVEN